MSLRIVLMVLFAFNVTEVAWAASGVMLRDDSLRASPSARAAQLGVVKKASPVSILENRGGWTRVSYKSAQGWVRLLFVRRGPASTTDLKGSLESAKEAASNRSVPGRITATAGLRGLDEADLKGAQFNEAELLRLEAQGVTTAEAQSFAAKAGLLAHRLEYIPAPTQSSRGQAGSGFDFMGGQ